MADKIKERLQVPPEFAMLLFGDGYLALIQGGIEKVNEEGLEIVEFMIEPSDLLRKRYEIEDSQLNENRALPFCVLKIDLIPMNLLDEANKKWLYIKTYDHQETAISRISWDLRKKVNSQAKQICLLEGENIWQGEQLQLARTNPAEFIMQGSELVEKSMARVLDLVKTKKDKGEE